MGTKKISRETSKTVQVKEDPVTKELYFDLPPGVLKSLGWREDDELEWYETQEGNWALRKVRLAEEPKDPARGERIKGEKLSPTVKKLLKEE